MRRKHLSFLFLTFCFFQLWSCSKNENFVSRINFINASRLFPNVSLRADSAAIINNRGIDSLAANVPFPSGTYNISLTNGSTSLSFTTNLEAGEVYTGLVYDSLGTTQFFMQKDAIPSGGEGGRCFVRFFNLVPGTTNLYLANDTGRGVISNRSYANFASSTGLAFTEADTISHATIRVDSSAQVLARMPRALLPGKVYTLYFVGRITDTLTGQYKPRLIVQQHN